MAEVPYLMRGMRQVATDSSVLVSSSPYLSNARLRDLVASRMLQQQQRGQAHDLGFALK